MRKGSILLEKGSKLESQENPGNGSGLFREHDFLI